MSNEKLVADVSDELFWEPKVHGARVAVSADQGVVTLRGTVGSLREKREAKKAAQRVFGVRTVNNELEVKLLAGNKRDDADLRRDVLQALVLDSLVPSTVDVKVEDGYVTLTGTAEQQYQRDEAEHVASNVLGVSVVTNDVELTGPPPDESEVRDGIEKAFKRNAKLDAEALSINISNATVTVSGTVNSWDEHDQAIEAAWAAPGVREVRDRLNVRFSLRA